MKKIFLVIFGLSLLLFIPNLESMHPNAGDPLQAQINTTMEEVLSIDKTRNALYAKMLRLSEWNDLVARKKSDFKLNDQKTKHLIENLIDSDNYSGLRTFLGMVIQDAITKTSQNNSADPVIHFCINFVVACEILHLINLFHAAPHNLNTKKSNTEYQNLINSGCLNCPKLGYIYTNALETIRHNHLNQPVYAKYLISGILYCALIFDASNTQEFISKTFGVDKNDFTNLSDASEIERMFIS